MYRTGDLAAWTAGGELVFAGRADDQVKIRGFRVEPREVETTLADCEQVAQAVVTISDHPAGGKQLIGYIVPVSPGDREGLAAVAREYAAARLPHYMVPDAFVVLEALPLAANGKVDRRSLPAPDYAAGSTGRLPSTRREEIVCEAFAEVLRLERVGVEDSFFALGGNSLLAVSLAEVLKNRGIPVSVRTLFQASTVAELLARLDLPDIGDGLGVLLPIRTQGNRPPFFCVHPVGGLSWCYMPLARYVPDGYPIYGLQARGLEGIHEPARSVPDMAADYVGQIRAVQPEGPYHLLGWSYGGIVVQEMAVQLQSSGEQIAALVIMDAFPVTDSRHRDGKGRRLPAASRPRPGAVHPDSAQGYSREAVAEQIRRDRGVILAAVSAEEIPVFQRVILNNQQIMGEHQVQLFEGDMLLVTATQTAPDDSAAKWTPYISGEITELALAVTHHDLVQPGMLAQIWDQIAEWLER
jgi:thioesterase domain-containing protein